MLLYTRSTNLLTSLVNSTMYVFITCFMNPEFSIYLYRGSSPYANLITANFINEIFQNFPVFPVLLSFKKSKCALDNSKISKQTNNFITAIFMIQPNIEKVAVMKYFGQKTHQPHIWLMRLFPRNKSRIRQGPSVIGFFEKKLSFQ